MKSSPKIIAHRGFSSQAPENTLAAFQKAIDSGADYLELDVHQTKDGEIVVIHDETIDRTASNESIGQIKEMTVEEATDVRVGYPEKFGEVFRAEKIPTLREVLQLAKGKIKVCIEIKVHEIEEKVLQIINAVGVSDEVIVFSFYVDVLAKIRQLDAKIPLLFLVEEVESTTLKDALEIHAIAVGCWNEAMPSNQFVDELHRNGMEIWTYTVDDLEEMKTLLELGIDGIITNCPDKALELRRTIEPS